MNGRLALALVALAVAAVRPVAGASYFNPDNTSYSDKEGIEVKGDSEKTESGRSFTIDASADNPATVTFKYEVILTGGCYDSVNVVMRTEKVGKCPMKYAPATASWSGTLVLKAADRIYVEMTMRATENPFGSTQRPYYPGAATVSYSIKVSYGGSSEDGGSDVSEKARVSFDANGGEGEMASVLYDLNVSQPWPENKFTREGYWFVGWSSSPDGKNTKFRKYFFQEDRSYAKPVIGMVYSHAGDYTYYAVWKKQGFIIHYTSGESKTSTWGLPAYQYCEPNKVAQLIKCPYTHWKKFAGWQCSNGKFYDAEMLVHDLGTDGETVTMTAIWE